MAGEYQPSEMKRRDLRRALKSRGFDEAVNFSFIDAAHDDHIQLLPAMEPGAGNEPRVTLNNPIIDEAVRMRPTLLPGLLESVRHNLNHGNRDVRLFEIGRVFAGSKAKELPLELDALALIATGGALEEGQAQASRELDFYELKGALEAAVEAMKLGPLSFQKANVKHLRDGQAATITLANGTAIGNIGRLAESIAGSYKFRQAVYVAELDLTALLGSTGRSTQYAPLPRYPAVVRDVTLLVGRDVTFRDLVQAIDSQAIADYQGVELVGVYEGENIPEDQRSITLRMEYRSDDGTLRDEEVEQQHRGLIDSLLIKFNAKLH
jgi:phenylalanyl-tRNA synthetase beta chain